MEKKEEMKLVQPEVILSLKAIKKIMLHTIEYSSQLISKWRWKEVIGLLGGKILDKKVIINDSFAINHGSSTIDQYHKKNYVMGAAINSILNEKNNEFFVGWYHSHPGFGFFLSNTDVITHIGYQDVNPYAVALVFDHTKIHSQGKFFKIYRLRSSKFRGYSGSMELSYKIKGILIKNEVEELKFIYNRLVFYRKIDFVESAEKSLKKWLKNIEKKD